MIDFALFEREVMLRVLTELPQYEEKLLCQYNHASVAKRVFTGHGFYTNYSDIPSHYSLGDRVRLELGSLHADLNDMKHGVGFCVFVCQGVITCLEGYAYDEPWPDTIEQYSFADEETQSLKHKLRDAMIDLGFEERWIGGAKNYVLGESYIKFTFKLTYAVVEIASSEQEAENYLHEDLEMYQYDCLKEHDLDLFDEIMKDLIRYVVKPTKETK